MISIIVPVYNVAEYLPRCMDSILRQEYTDIEVIVVDDGSTDGSGGICDSYARRDSRIRVIHKSNGGLSSARNAGMEVASGKYIFFLDSDDSLSHDAIRTLHDFAEANRCEVVQGGFYYAFDDHLELDTRWLNEDTPPFVLEKEDAMKQLVKQQYVKNFAWGKLYLAALVKGLPFPEGVYFEDSFWQHLVIGGSLRYGVIPRPLYYYSQRPSGISGTFSLRQMDLLRGNGQRLDYIIEKFPSLEGSMASFYWHLCWDFRDAASHSDAPRVKEEFEAYYQKAMIRYGALFEKALKRNTPYLLERHGLVATTLAYTSLKRLYAHFFAPRLKYIPVK